MKALVATWVLPILATTLPPIVYPHLLSFILPVGCWVVVCFAFLCTSAVLMRVRQARSDASAAPSLALEQPATLAASRSSSIKFN